MEAKGQTAERMVSGMPCSFKRKLGDDAERALRADEETGEVVAARRFAGAISVLSSAPSAITALRLNTLSRMVP